MHPEKTIFDHLRETGISGQLSIAVFLTGIAFAGWVHFRQLGFRYRIALIPFSLLPLIIGVFGLAVGIIEIIHAFQEACIRPDANWLLSYFGEIIQIIPLTSIETISLMIVSIILLVLGKENPSKPDQNGHDAPSNGG